MSRGALVLVLLAGGFWSAGVLASGLLMARSGQEFPEAMATLQQSIAEHGYRVSRVQRVDIGLTSRGYRSDRYRVVFFGKLHEFRELVARNPALVPYLPLSISIFAEGDQTVLVTIDPVYYRSLLDDPSGAILLERCASDLRSILNDVRTAQ